MAMARSIVAPLLLLSVLVSTAAAARAVGAADSVQDVCSKTQFPKTCVDMLAAKPEAQKATPRKLAELFVNIAAEKGAGMATFVHGKYNGVKDSAMVKCYDSCSDDVEEAVAHLNGLVREPTDAKFLELKSWLSSTLGGTSTCEDACKDLPKNSDKDDVVSFSLEFEKLQRVTLDLITEASGSMSADIALPPSDAAAPSAYGAAAPPLGASAEAPAGGEAEGPAGGSAEAPAAGSEGPAASASGPSAADAPAYGAAASGPAAADAPAASSSEAASAPAPSSSEAADAPGPSSDDDSSAPSAPTSGGDADDADGDDVGGSA